MKTGTILKSTTEKVSDEELRLINTYTRRELSSDEVYTFSVVLCDNDIDRDFERFTVESLFELEKLFVGKTGIFDHDAKASNQTARIYSCKVEAVESQKTSTGDDYFRLVAKAYIPRSEKNEDIILSLDSGIVKEVSVGCAVKSNLCSICSNDIHSPSCTHRKGEKYGNTLCYSELVGVFDAYEFSFVAIPAQKNAGVTKSYLSVKEENKNMKEILKSLNGNEKLTLDEKECKSLSAYIASLEDKAKDGELYREELFKSVLKTMSITQPNLGVDTIKGILKKLSTTELSALKESYKRANTETGFVQLKSENKAKTVGTTTEKNNQFTI